MLTREAWLTKRLAERGEELEKLKEAARLLLRNMDRMHARGETFTAGVSVSAARLRELV